MWWRRRAANETPPTTAASDAPTPPGGHAEALLHQLEWTVLRRLDGQFQGAHRTLMRGGGLDLADLREYQPHDDVRHIDWNVTARLQSPHVRQYLEDRDVTAWLVLDVSPSMDFGSGQRSKRQVQREWAAALARLLTRHGNRVGALMYGAGPVRVLPARGGRSQVLRLIQELDSLHHPHQPPNDGGTRLAEWLQAAGHFLRRRSAVFVASDFFSDPGWEKPLGQLALRHDVLAVRLYDPLERNLPDLGLLPLDDAESGERLWVDTHDRGFRERFHRLAAERETRLREALGRARVDALELSTEDDIGLALLHLAALRKHRPLGARTA